MIEVCIVYVYIDHVDVVWDSEKARTNLNKYGVRFSDAEMVLFDPNALTREDTDAEGTCRRGFGRSCPRRCLFVSWRRHPSDIGTARYQEGEKDL